MSETTILQPGDSMPSFELKNQRNEPIRSAELKGKWVVLYFYPRDNTPGCTTEAKDFTDLKPEFEKHNVIIYGVSKDSVASHEKFSTKQCLEIDLLSDPDHKVIDAFGAWQLKKNYGKESMGTVRSTFLINPEGIVQRSWDKVKVKGHVDEVLTELKKSLS
jgi:thioredoxin-dependent peroxiredoxin